MNKIVANKTMIEKCMWKGVMRKREGRGGTSESISAGDNLRATQGEAAEPLHPCSRRNPNIPLKKNKLKILQSDHSKNRMEIRNEITILRH